MQVILNERRTVSSGGLELLESGDIGGGELIGLERGGVGEVAPEERSARRGSAAPGRELAEGGELRGGGRRRIEQQSLQFGSGEAGGDGHGGRSLLSRYDVVEEALRL